ncbi:hypothetical protein [Pectinatus frisingensis]|nr:hypothetical protein [Pectinatus frisingensis]
MDIIQNNLKATIKQARLATNLTQDELAEQVDILGASECQQSLSLSHF